MERDDRGRYLPGMAIALEIPGGCDVLREIVIETGRAFGADEAYARLIVTWGVGALGVDPASCPESRVIYLVDRISIYSAEKCARGIDLVTASWRRPPAELLDLRVKSLNYLNNALAVLEAKQRGADDALLLNAAGAIAEAAVANVFALRDGELLTPPGTDGALEGITRRTVLEIAPELGIRARVATLGRLRPVRRRGGLPDGQRRWHRARPLTGWQKTREDRRGPTGAGQRSVP